MPQSVLVVDDEPKIVALLVGYLEASGFKVHQAFDGNGALAVFREMQPDCLVLDINMPGMDGLSVAREVRKKSDLPIIFLTARADEMDRIIGLELGADDYVSKPFSPRELVARVKAVLRRAGPKEGTDSARIVRGTVSLDARTRRVTIGGTPLNLTAVQFDILALIIREPGRAWSRLEILEGFSGSSYEGYERTIDAHIKNIRKAMGDDSDAPRFIETVRGIGYRFMEQKDGA
ncbi:MAG: DNA-binding response regulator [Treponema sp. GWB1_62_6]|nr:MAG: DNA-binding response regulator [Treponema sp. GWB1_62_6]OHE62854.1 MAG: DNA-binding response regulator [Treponema sp. GWA1_62_8]OHE66019.1 MAG: DNA-binding response regulator [Treponema sp. GWC1_61_84]OHE74955.1 MAG: DNA-binding response regulator [Treponema sp. RIFOXYC1_FULL_61_9]HCM25084.1 DNA-binding response regulator [Treponema sp.]